MSHREVALTVGNKRKAADVDPEALRRQNDVLQDQNYELRQKLRRLIAQGALRPQGVASSDTPQSNSGTPTNPSAIETSTTSPIATPSHGYEESETVSQSVPAETLIEAAPSTVGLAHLLTFLSIVLCTYGKMPKLVVNQMLALATHQATEPVAPATTAGGDDITAEHRAVLSSWRRLLLQHRLSDADLVKLGRRLRASAEQTEMRLPTLSYPSSAAA